MESKITEKQKVIYIWLGANVVLPLLLSTSFDLFGGHYLISYPVIFIVLSVNLYMMLFEKYYRVAFSSIIIMNIFSIFFFGGITFLEAIPMMPFWIHHYYEIYFSSDSIYHWSDILFILLPV